jgi:curved DNA-binding protein CbpA
VTPEAAAGLLELDPGANRAEIDRQFRRRARASHPDLLAHASPAAIAAATAEFVRMSAARDALLAELDRLHDAALAESAAHAAPEGAVARAPQQRPGGTKRSPFGPRSEWVTRGPGDAFLPRTPASDRPMTFAEFVLHRDAESWIPYREPTFPLRRR